MIHGDPKLGLGLWYNKLATFGLEALLLIGSLVYYFKNSTAPKPLGKWLAIAFTLFLILVNYIKFYVLPQENDLTALTLSALGSYFLLAGIAWWVGKARG